MQNYKYLSLIVFSLMFLGCDRKPASQTLPTHITENQFVTIASDTIYTEIKGKLWRGVLHGDRYYTVYSYKQGEGYMFPLIKEFHVFDRFGANHEKPPIAGEMYKSYWCSFKVIGDSVLFVPPNFSDTVYFNEQIPVWEQVHNIMIPNYEDDLFFVSSIDRGEFGGMVFFREKATNNLYGAIANSVIAVNKYKDHYYVTNYLGHMMDWSSIIRIDLPQKMLQLKDYVRDNEMWLSDFWSDQGTTMMYEDEIVLYTSFVHRNRLFHVNSNSDGMNLSLLENGQLNAVYTLEDIISIRLVQQKDSNYQLLQFDSEENKSGFIEITPDTIYIHYIVSLP